LIDTKIKKSTQIEKTKILNELIEKMNTQILNLKLLQSKRDKPDTYKKLENKIQIYTQIKNILISKKTPKTEIVVKKIDEKFQKISSYKAKNGKIYKIIEN
jgi:murein L,D-transpeptidase YafK